MRKWGKHIYEGIQRHLTLLKGIFILSVMVFVILEVGRIFRDLNGEQLKASLTTQSPWTLLAMLVIGFVAVLPMLNYDFVIAELLPEDYSFWYKVKSGWIVNTFTNIAGFGGFLGASLRANFYGKKASQKEILIAISKIALFLLAGLSIWCLISVVLIFGFGIGGMYANYWLWLVGGSLYFPGLMISTRFKNAAFFKDLSMQRVLRLTLGSFLEWGFAGGFFLTIGYFLEIKGDLLQVLPLFMIANIIGVISMVPGGLGTFDLFMIFGLSAVGVQNADAVVWLSFYRVFYYIVPFLVGVGLFTHDAGSRLNHYLQGLPRQVMQKIAHHFIVFFLYISSIILLLVATVPNFAITNTVIGQLYPYTFFFLDRVTNIIVAFVMLALARGVANRVQKVFWPLMVLLVIAIANTLWRDFSIKLAVFLTFVLVASFLLKRELYRERIEFSWNDRIVDGVLFVGAFLLYGFVGIANSPHLRHRKPVPTALLFPSERVWLAGFIGMLVAAGTLYLVYRYLSRGGRSIAAPYDEARIANVINTYGGNEVSHLAYLRDKSVYFYQEEGEDQVFLLYRKKADRLIVMGEPVGNPAKILPAIEQMMHDADLIDCHLAFYEISSELTMQLHEIGFDFIKFGEEGYVRLADFTMTGKKRRAERALMNKFEREGYQFEILNPPFSAELMAELKAVSDDWLGSRVEKGFSLGFFDEAYLQKAPIAVVYNADHQLIAFANEMPTGTKEVASIDLMRHRQDAPSGIMDEIFINLFEQNRTDGYTYFNLGMAPLANVGTSEFSFIEERIAHLIYEYGYHFYGFQGLRTYKKKYTTEWRSKYIAYQKRTSLIFTMVQVLMVVNQRVADQPHPGGLLGRLMKSVQIGKFSDN
ncbi:MULTISPECIES: bifunctional lysylphosphatidylglycerol flippase/synthetase MprF [Latilactobacillus]|uniref:bifunctional lysylphosphatidylglycerol flippase/synthetase MprF n=1 Tax=Latilactobacillus TaxID=2767885 RepID=UPI0020C7B550|nr:bifunctional lysylphosphatidylglycerol flippase/synthetase MprF [Latilactobacillus curvatus]MCP8862119.1 bifunctional lysylphosphatidylglycerol flippase/synthetase MprF [Latilactobacillus curvatus]MCP8868362.1 bifunctional lysylphosphatidylglycerol flippase/synthetase MprF [Latilactobacillus curvatus]MCP8871904.1 bifunctional lysylphosphatidylglycerol flippase/synthetase MprF [Latilactobacillus curvatus]MCP8880948.1 bifunctional lysylphosphatidylglycerol flippase/synthetase MprF [Latilactoba